MRPPELHADLCGTASIATQTARTLHKLHQELVVLTELIDRLRACGGLREPDKYGDQYEADKHLRLAVEGRYREAVNLIALRGLLK